MEQQQQSSFPSYYSASYLDQTHLQEEHAKQQLDRFAAVIQRYFRRYLAGKQIQRIDTQHEEDQEEMFNLATKGRATAAKLQADIQVLKQQLQSAVSLKKEKAAKKPRESQEEEEEEEEHQKSRKDQYAELKEIYEQQLEESLLRQKCQFEEILNSYLEFVDRQMASKKEIGDSCKQLCRLFQGQLVEARRLEKAKSLNSQHISELYQAQSILETQNQELRQEIADLQRTIKDKNEMEKKQKGCEQSDQQDLQEKADIVLERKQLSFEREELKLEKDGIQMERDQLHKLIAQFNESSSREMIRHNRQKDEIQLREAEIREAKENIKQQKEDILDRLRELSAQEVAIIDRERKILDILEINKTTREKYKLLKAENHQLKKQLKEQFTDNLKNATDSGIQQGIDEKYILKETQLGMKNSRQSSSLGKNNGMLMSSGDRNIDNNKVNNYEEKLDLAGLIKEERLRTESILRGFKENS